MPESSTKKGAPDPEQVAREREAISPHVKDRIGLGVDEMTALLVLDAVKGFGPQKFKELHEADVSVSEVLGSPDRLPTRGKRGDDFRRALAMLDDEAWCVAEARAVRQLLRAEEHSSRIVTYSDELYPPTVYASNNPIPILYVRGRFDLLRHEQAVACVGSRDIGPPYDERHHQFATHAAGEGWNIVSGFALGADTIGHRAAYQAGGATTLVMPCGLDRPFPPENKPFWQELLDYPRAVMVSEFPFGTSAAALTLRKRNKLIVAFAQGVLLSQSSRKGGAMNAYRFAREQHKPVATFAHDGLERSSGNRQIDQDPAPAQPTLDAEHASGWTAVFPADAPDPQAWGKWLQQLSSWT